MVYLNGIEYPALRITKGIVSGDKNLKTDLAEATMFMSEYKIDKGEECWKPVVADAVDAEAVADVVDAEAVADAVADEVGVEPTSHASASASTSTRNGTASARTKRPRSTRYATKLPRRSGRPLRLRLLKKRNRTSMPVTASARTRTRSATDSSMAMMAFTLMSSLPTTTPTQMPRRGSCYSF
jgi:hypothetical protein